MFLVSVLQAASSIAAGENKFASRPKISATVTGSTNGVNGHTLSNGHQHHHHVHDADTVENGHHKNSHKNGHHGHHHHHTHQQQQHQHHDHDHKTNGYSNGKSSTVVLKSAGSYSQLYSNGKKNGFIGNGHNNHHNNYSHHNHYSDFDSSDQEHHQYVNGQSLSFNPAPHFAMSLTSVNNHINSSSTPTGIHKHSESSSNNSSSIKSGSLPGHYFISNNSMASSPSSGGRAGGAAELSLRHSGIGLGLGNGHSPSHHHPPLISHHSLPGGPISSSNGGGEKDSHQQQQQHSKKWTFGGFFKRKSKNGPSSASPTPPVPVPASSLPAHLSRSSTYLHPNPIPKPARAIEFSSDLTSSDDETTLHHPLPPSSTNPPSSAVAGAASAMNNNKHQNFLVRRLSKRKEKAAKSKLAAVSSATAAADENGFLKVPLQNGRRVGSSPDSLAGINGNGNNIGNHPWTPWQGWETTKKSPTPILNSGGGGGIPNYSSSGSLTVSMGDGGSSSRGSRAAAREAVKARAVARRESFLNESSSSDEGEGSSSLQGSHSSLSSRNRRIHAANGGAGNGSKRLSKPELIHASNNTSGHGHGHGHVPVQAPPSPRWEARIVYTQETIEQGEPVVIRLPKSPASNANGGGVQNNSRHNNFYSDDQQEIITAGLKVPLVVPNTSMSPYPPEDRTYANLPDPNFSAQQSAAIIVTAANNRQTVQSPYTLSSSAAPTPPPRDFRMQQPQPQQQNNFYRPVSCSYLDSYHQHQQQQQQQQQQFLGQGRNIREEFVAPIPIMANNGYGLPQQQQQRGRHVPPPMSTTMDNNGEGSPYRVQYENYEHPNHQQMTTPGDKKIADTFPKGRNVNGGRIGGPILKNSSQNFVRSPSEPPEMKSQQQQHERHNFSTETGLHHHHHQPVIMSTNMSKLGFPVRKLSGAAKLPATQSPVHMRASEFWRKKEQEVTGGGDSSVSPNPFSQKRFLSRIRSADSSPVPAPRHLRSSPSNQITNLQQSQHSNESISSLSSFSAEAPSPHNNNNHNNNSNNSGKGSSTSPSTTSSQKLLPSGPLRPQTLSLKSPGFSISSNSNSAKSSSDKLDKENNPTITAQATACERLKVRFPSQSSSSSLNNLNSREASVTPPGQKQQSTVRSPSSSRVVPSLGGMSSPSPPPPHSSQPQSQKSMARSDTPMSQNNNNNTPSSSSMSGGGGKTPGKNLEDALNELEDMYKSLRLSDEDLLDRAERRDLPTPHQELRNAPELFRFSPQGSYESGLDLASSASANGKSTPSSYYGSENNIAAGGGRARAPPLRRSCRPDAVADDMAKRRFDQAEVKANDPRQIVSKTGSYMLLSPAFSPPASPAPSDHPHNNIITFYDDPDLTLDDVTFRNYKRANAIRIIDPQPLFGIPLGPLTPAPASDYLHSEPKEKFRPIFRHTKRPDVVKDDIAFRNLRKDLNQENNLSKDWTPRLFPSKVESNFCYNIQQPEDGEIRSKKLRAIRSLSANISHLIPFKDSAVSCEIGKWNSFTDLHRNGGGASPRASTYMQPSWVEQIERLQQNASSGAAHTSTETLAGNRTSGDEQQQIPQRPKQHQPVILTNSTSSIGPDGKPRRPWTDILLDSFEKEKQEIERLNAAAKEAEENLTTIGVIEEDQIHQQRQEEPKTVEEMDDDVFLDQVNDEDQVETAASKQQQQQQQQHHNTNQNYKQQQQQQNYKRNISSPLARFSTPPESSSSSKIQSPVPIVEPEEQEICEAAAALFDPNKIPQPKKRQPKSSRSNINNNFDNLDNLREDFGGSDNKNKLNESTTTTTTSRQQNTNENSLPFTPLPPPRKVMQIHLDGFDNSSNNYQKSQPNFTQSHQHQQQQQQQQLGDDKQQHVVPPSSSPKPPRRGEQELNDLLDALEREADTCGPEKGGQNRTVENPTPSSPSSKTTTTTSVKTDSISELIDSINEIENLESTTTTTTKASSNDDVHDENQNFSPGFSTTTTNSCSNNKNGQQKDSPVSPSSPPATSYGAVSSSSPGNSPAPLTTAATAAGTADSKTSSYRRFGGSSSSSTAGAGAAAGSSKGQNQTEGFAYSLK